MPVDVLQDSTAEIIARLSAVVHEAVLDEADDALEDWQKILAAPKHGRNYSGHIASAPGEAPANEKNTLTDSLEIRMRGAFSGAIEATGDGLQELEWLENGTPKMDPRPSVDRVQEIVDKRFPKRLKKAVAKVSD